MFKVVTIEHIRRIEAAADASGISYDQMMQNAGRATADRALTIIANLPDARVTLLIGPGNNGGDGLVAGRLIAEDSSAQVRFYMLKRRGEEDSNYSAAKEAGLFFAYTEDDKDNHILKDMIASADLVIDGFFGIGIRLPIRESVAGLLRTVTQVLDERRTSIIPTNTIDPAVPTAIRAPRPYVLAVDCPSGLESDTGELDPSALFADETVTFIAAKPGLFAFPGAAAVGKLALAAIGVPNDLPELQRATWTVAAAASIRTMLPSRPLDGHKGTFGKAMIVAGSENYIGAPALAAQAAYRAGAGLVTIGAPAAIVNTLAARQLETTWLTLPDDNGVVTQVAMTSLMNALPAYNALLIGPGWGRDAGTRQLLNTLLSSAKDGAIHLPPLIIDADGLNLLSEIESWWTLLPSNAIITPHPREIARLSGLSTKEIQANRWQIAQEKAQEWGVVLVLKGAHTLIAAPDGHVTVLPFKNDALATAGTGDVLAGILVGLMAQSSPVYEAAVVGGYIHGLAGEIAAERGSSRSVIASDVTTALPDAFRRLEI